MLCRATTGEKFFYNLLVIYLFLSLVLTCYSVIRMYIVKHFCNGVKYGKARIKQLTAQGRFRQLPVYSLDEIYEDKDLGTVRLSVFRMIPEKRQNMC